MAIEEFPQIPHPHEVKKEGISRGQLATVIQKYLFETLRLSDAIEDACLPNAAGTIDADVYFDVSIPQQDIVHNYIHIIGQKNIFERITKEEIEKKVQLLAEGNYLIQSTVFKYRIPASEIGTDNPGKYIVESKRSLPLS
jgi:hypothetical protein